MAQLEHIEAIEKRLWSAADTLRANSNYEYFLPVMGLVFLRHAYSRFLGVKDSIEGVNDCRGDFDAINIVYKSLQKDREQADITGIIRQLHQVVDEALRFNTMPGMRSRPPTISARLTLTGCAGSLSAARPSVQPCRT